MNSFYTPNELKEVGFASVGENVLVSRKASIYNPQAIHLGSYVRIDDFCILSGGGGIRMGSYIHIGAYTALYASAPIELEDYAGISARCIIYTGTDDYTGKSMTNPMVPDHCKPGYTSAPVKMMEHSILGANSTVLPGVVLETGAAVWAHSLVTKTCPEWGIYFGVPAKRVKNRNRDLLQFENRLQSVSHSVE